MDNQSLANTPWNCKYHIVFVPKYRKNIWKIENIYIMNVMSKKRSGNNSS